MTVRHYTLPSTSDERLRLLASIERDASEVLEGLGFRVRDPHRKAWHSKSMTELRACAERWRGTAEKKRAKLL